MGYSCSKQMKVISCVAPVNKPDTNYENLKKSFQVHDAIQRNNFKKARSLISNGTDVNCINYYGATPLIETCKGRRPDRKTMEREHFVRFLIQNGADTYQPDIYGWKALLYAQENGHTLIAKILENIEGRKSKIEKRVDEDFFCEVRVSLRLSRSYGGFGKRSIQSSHIMT